MADVPRIRFRLPHWGWLLLATVIMVIAGTVLAIWLPYHREQKIITRIELYGGRVETFPLAAPKWLQNRIGTRRLRAVKVFDRVDQVYFPEGAFADNVLSHVRGLTHLSILPLDGTNVTDAGLAHLSSLSKNEFEHFSVERTRITDAGLVHLGKLKRIDFLNLSETRINGAGIAHLGNVRSLWLSNTNITDDELAGLAGFQNLEYLSLYRSAVTNSGIKHLYSLTSLKHLSLNETKVTDKGIEELKTALPHCKIDR